MQRKKKKFGFLFSLAGVTIIVAVWWILAETRFKQTGIIPNPIKTLQIIGVEMKKDSFFKAVFSTLERAFISFLLSFTVASIAALLAHYKKFVGKIINPFIVLSRSMPTMALVLILLITVGSDALPLVVAFLVVFPLCYENMRTAISEVDPKRINMANVFKMPKHRQITGIYIPAMLPYIFSSIIAGFGLNIKVVISAEVMGLPSMSIGQSILSAKQGFDWGTAFAWLVIAVVLSLIFEIILKAVRRLCMPYKYPDLKILKNGFSKIFLKRKRARAVSGKNGGEV